MQVHSPSVFATQHSPSELDRLGDEIAELSAHLDAATTSAVSNSSATTSYSWTGRRDAGTVS